MMCFLLYISQVMFYNLCFHKRKLLKKTDIICQVPLTVIQLRFAVYCNCTAQTSDENKWLTRVLKSFAEISLKYALIRVVTT